MFETSQKKSQASPLGSPNSSLENPQQLMSVNHLKTDDSPWLPGLVNLQKTMENHHVEWVTSLKRVIFNSYVSHNQRVC